MFYIVVYKVAKNSLETELWTIGNLYLFINFGSVRFNLWKAVFILEIQTDHLIFLLLFMVSVDHLLETVNNIVKRLPSVIKTLKNVAYLNTYYINKNGNIGKKITATIIITLTRIEWYVGYLRGIAGNVKDSQYEPWSSDVSSIPGFTSKLDG